MKITKNQLRRIIKEEKAKLNEQPRATAMGQTARSDEMFGARENLLALIESLLDPNEAKAYIDDLVMELEAMKRNIDLQNEGTSPDNMPSAWKQILKGTLG